MKIQIGRCDNRIGRYHRNEWADMTIESAAMIQTGGPAAFTGSAHVRSPQLGNCRDSSGGELINHYGSGVERQLDCGQ